METQYRLPLLTLLVAGLASWLLPHAARGATPPRIGDPAPVLRARAFDGSVVDLAAWRGHPVVLHYWASWCVPCREEMPRLDALYREAHARGLEVLALSADDRHDRKSAVGIAAAFGFPAGMVDEAEADGFGRPQALPTTWVIDAQGRISAVLRANRGSVSEAALREAVLPLLAAGGSGLIQ